MIVIICLHGNPRRACEQFRQPAGGSCLSERFGAEVQTTEGKRPGFRENAGLLESGNLREILIYCEQHKKEVENDCFQNILKNTCKNSPEKWRK